MTLHWENLLYFAEFIATLLAGVVGILAVLNICYMGGKWLNKWFFKGKEGAHLILGLFIFLLMFIVALPLFPAGHPIFEEIHKACT